MKNIIVLSNGNEWCYWCWKGFLESRHATFLRNPFPVKSKLLLWLCWKHFSPKYKFPFKWIWYRLMLHNLGIDKHKDNIIIVYDWNQMTRDASFIKLLKRNNTKVVYVFTNIVQITGATTYHLLDRLKEMYDYVFAFDRLDAKKYGFLYHPLIYEKITLPESSLPQSDLFYVGQAKDRLDILLEIFEEAERHGLSCDFHIIGVPNEKQKYADKIHYNQPLHYEEVLKHINSTRCLVDAIQGNSTGLTIKVCESIIFNKKLITTNVHVKEEIFYAKGNIWIYEDPKSMADFVKEKQVDYEPKDYSMFTVESMLAEIK